jgi:hypothetical protein
VARKPGTESFPAAAAVKDPTVADKDADQEDL